MTESTNTGPKLSHFIEDGSTLKPDMLVDKPVTIVDSLSVLRKDGTTAYKWVVEWQHGELSLHWAAGMAPPLEVAKWFRDYPGVPLHVVLRRKDVGNGYPHWHLEQIEHATATTPATQAADDVEVDQVPF
jgi:hypothetical protein